MSKDPIGLEGGLNLYEAFGNDPVCFRDPEGLSGVIAIYTDLSGDGKFRGHAWISYTPDRTGNTTTYGTWGLKHYKGLFSDREKGRKSTVSRCRHIDDAGEIKLYIVIIRYLLKKENAWERLNPCSGFASEAWREATGEFLQDRNFFHISTPVTLSTSIQAANVNDQLSEPDHDE